MTELEPYRAEVAYTRTDLRNATTDSWTDVLEEVGDLANRIAGTEFVPDSFRGKVAPVAAAVLYGREIGMPPMTALQTIHSIKGRVGLSAEGMRALVLQAGHELVVSESSSSKCVMKGRRRGAEEWTTVEWTIADARQAGLLNGSGWKNYPRQMLQARASSELVRLAFPDVIRGLASLEELEQLPAGAAAGAPAEAVDTTTGEVKATVQRKPRKKAPPKREQPEEPELPGDETGEGVDVAGGGEAPEASAPEPPLPEDTSPRADGADSHGAAGQGPGDSGSPSDESPGPDPEDPLLDEDGAVDAEVIDDEPPLTAAQRTSIMARFNALDVPQKERAERLRMSSVIVGRTLGSANDLTKDEASTLIDTLEMCKTREDLDSLVGSITRSLGDDS